MMLCTVVLALLLGALVPASARAPRRHVPRARRSCSGESQHGNNHDAIDVLAYSWGMSNSSNVAAKIAGKVNFQNLSFTKYIDRSSPVMLTTAAAGR